MADAELMTETEETWDDWVDEGSESALQCLFCKEQLSTLLSLHEHLEQAHGFSLQHYIAHFELDMYGAIQLVNFLRTQNAQGVSIENVKSSLSNEGKALFAKDEFMKPFIENDPVLYSLDLDSDEDDSDDDDEEHKFNEAPSKASKEKSLAVLEQENQQLKEQLAKSSSLLSKVVDDSGVQVQTKADNDTYYFDSYSKVGIHREMLEDRVRTEGYRNAILNNESLFKDKVVLDVGCGSGILSLFAAQAGAKRVIGIDSSEMADVAQAIVRANKYESVITILKGKVEDLELPVDGVDIIVSEWMGYNLLYEAMLDTVLVARDRWLREGGHVFPDKSSMHLQVATDSARTFEFWEDVYGFDMTPLRSKITVADGFVQDVPASDILSDRALLKDIDIATVKYDDLDYESAFELTIASTGVMHAFVSSFDIGFEKGCEKPEYFTTGVEGETTHWHQVLFHLGRSVQVTAGDRVVGKWRVRRNAENPRCMDVDIEWKKEGDESMNAHRFKVQ